MPHPFHTYPELREFALAHGLVSERDEIPRVQMTASGIALLWAFTGLHSMMDHAHEQADALLAYADPAYYRGMKQGPELPAEVFQSYR